MATIFRAGAGDVDPDIVGMRFEDHDPTRDPTIGPVKSVDEYLRQNLGHGPEHRQYIPDQVREFSAVYGDQIHEVRGNGDCGTTAFAGALLYLMNESPEKAEQIVPLIMNLASHGDLTHQLRDDIEEVIGPILQLQKGRDDHFRDELLGNRSFALALSRVVRAIGYYNIPLVMKDRFDEMGIPEEERQDYAALWISRQATEGIEVPGYQALSRIFGVRIHVRALTERREDVGKPLYFQYYPSDREEYKVIDIAILRKGAHYLFVVPDKERQRAHGLVDAAPLRQAVIDPIVDADARVDHVAREAVANGRDTQQEIGMVKKIIIGAAGIVLAAGYTLLFTDIGKAFINSFF